MLGDVRGDVRVPPFLPARSFVASTGFPGLSTLKSTQQGWMDGLTSSREHDNIIYHDILMLLNEMTDVITASELCIMNNR